MLVPPSLKPRLKKPLTVLLIASTALLTPLAARPNLEARTELPPSLVLNSVYDGIREIHGQRATPELYAGGRRLRSSCGVIQSSAYCPFDHMIFIPQQDINIAYQHGDAALAYIVAHEYAHAMQTAFRFQPRSTPMSELQADCLAGVYLGLIPNLEFDRSDIGEIISFAHRIGDYDWNSRHHHGTPRQRRNAVAKGMNASAQGKQGLSVCL